MRRRSDWSVAGLLEAFPVHNGWAGFVVLLFRDPHLLEGGQRGQDGTTDPDRIFALGGRDDLDLHGGRGQRRDFLLHTVGDAGVHGGATRQHGVGVQILTDVDVAFHDRVVGGLVDSARFHSQEGRLEQGFGATESLVSDGDDLTVGKFVRLFERGGRSSSGHLLLEIKSDVAKFLLDITNDFTLGSGGEGISALGQDLHQVIGQIATSEIQTQDGVGQGVTFIDGHCVRDTVARVEHDTSGTTRGVEREHGLDGDVHRGGVEGLEHDL